MEEDDEFGDLYTDVLQSFTSSSVPQPHQVHSTPPSLTRLIDPNGQSDDEEILFGASNSKPSFSFASSSQKQALVFKLEKTAPDSIVAGNSDSHRILKVDDEFENQVDKEKDLAGDGNNWGSESTERTKMMILGSSSDVKMQKRAFEDPNFMDDSAIDVVVDERDDKDDLLVEKDETTMGKRENFENLGTEEEVNTGIKDLGLEPIIPGLSITGVSVTAYQEGANTVTQAEASGEGDNWDSDSEDDLQIVLNDNNHGPMAMDRTGAAGPDDDDDDEDEDGDPLVIVADIDPNNQPMDEQEWGEDAAHGTDGEKKELGDAAKVNGGVAVVPKIGYSNHVYHPFHSQFKYVRPGAAPMPGVAPAPPGGASGQVRPPVNMGPIAGRGRGDWRPMGIKGGASAQKSFHPGFGMPVWGNNTPGRAFGSGLEFTLPSHKTIFDVEVESFEEKPWRLPGIDISDFFNFGLNEESWKSYCKQLEQLRLESTMQTKIRVYESGRTEQEYDPDLPPELAAAAGIHDGSSANANLEKTDTAQNDLSKGSAGVRPPLPTGRAIQVESGFGERLPSIDTRPPRIRDSDAIIEIVLQDSTEDDSSQQIDVAEQPENDHASEDLRGDHEIEEDIAQEDTEHFVGSSHAYNGRKGELVGRKASVMNSFPDNESEGDGTLPLPPEVPSQYHSDSKGRTAVYPGRNFGIPHEERRTKGRARDRSPSLNPGEGTRDKIFLDNQREESVESIDGKPSPLLSSPINAEIAGEPGVEHGESRHDELVPADGSSGMEREEIMLTKTDDSLKDEYLMHSMKKKKLNSRVEQPYIQELDNGEDLKTARSSENSKARSGSSRDYQKLRDGVEEEVIQDGHSSRIGNIKRPLGEYEQSGRRKGRDERHEIERHRLVVKGREDIYTRRDRDPNSVHSSHLKTEDIDRRKERDNSDGAWQQRDDDPHVRRTRPEDTRKRVRGDEMGSRHRSKVRESERSDKDEHLQLRKQLDNGSWKGHHDKDMGSRYRERDDNLKSRYENIDDLHSKRRKEEEHIRRDHVEKEEILHGHRENTTHRKRERDDIMDQRKRDDQARIREDDHHSVRHKEEGWFQRERSERQKERDEWHRPKQSHDESLSKREREEGRGGMRSGRAAEDKAWITHARVKDEYKGSDRDYQFKDTGRQSEQIKRRDRVEDGSSQHRGRENVYPRGIPLSNDERRSRQERAITRNDRSINASDDNRAHDKKHKENARKNKESEVGAHNSLGPSKRNQEDIGGQINEKVILKGISEQGNGRHDIAMDHLSSGKHRQDASSDDEQQDSRRGRSKLERWTSHKERDFSINTKSSSSLKVKAIDTYNSGASSFASKPPDVSSKTAESIDNQHPSGDEKDSNNPENKHVDVKQTEDKHLDTVAKLKKRSERFKLPMPSEKDAIAIKKMESEPLPSVQGETRAESEIKQERPARKRRWISN
ncbi:FIP1[V]-like protein [Cornus florida]|uniref:FIP1[V]-like protein n=1 Tax=Cornus florida TaxID=4283 RepID=UPI0028A1C9C9|nr:FIP1[V]-like protein [Cornus florida]